MVTESSSCHNRDFKFPNIVLTDSSETDSLKEIATSTLSSSNSSTSEPKNWLGPSWLREGKSFRKSFQPKRVTEKKLFDFSSWLGSGIEKGSPLQRSINSQITAVSESGIQGIEAILQICKKNVESFNGVNVSTALHRMAAAFKEAKLKQFSDLSGENQGQIKQLLPLIFDKMSELQPINLATVSWALGIFYIGDKKLFDGIAKRAIDLLNSSKQSDRYFKPREFSVLVNSFATLNYRNEILLIQICNEIASKAKKSKWDRCSVQVFANIAQGYSSLGFFNPDLFEVVKDRLMRKSGFGKSRFHECNDTELAMLSNSFATFVENRPDRRKEAFTVLMEVAKVLNIVAEEKRGRLPNKLFSLRSLSHLVWSLAAGGIENPVDLYRECHFSPVKQEQLAEIKRALTAICNEIIERGKVGSLDQLIPQDLVMILLAYAKLGWSDQSFYATIASTVVARAKSSNWLRTFNPQDISNLLVAFATAGVYKPQLFALGFKEVTRRINEDNLQHFKNIDLGSLVWALSVFSRLKKSLWLAVVNNLSTDSFQDESFRNQIFQAYIEARLKKITTPKKAMTLISQYMDKESQQKPISSNFHKEVAKLLSSFKNEFVSEYCIGNFYWVDICFPKRSLCIEVDGPYHHMKRGADRLKERHLKEMGWRVCRVGYKKWNQLKTDKNKVAFLKRLVKVP